MNAMTLRKEEMDARNLKNKTKYCKVLNQIIVSPDNKETKKKIKDYSDFNKFIEEIKNAKSKKLKKDLMLHFINQTGDEINETIE